MLAALIVAPVLASALAGSTITLPAAPPGESEVFVLQDYRWISVIVKRPPTSIDCSFDVVTGTPTVHAELLTDRDFTLFSRGREYETLARTQTGKAGGFHHVALTEGRYRVLIMNNSGAPPAAVSLIVRTNVDSSASRSIGVSSLRKLTVILGSLTVFLGTVAWSGSRLLRAWRNRGQIFK